MIGRYSIVWIGNNACGDQRAMRVKYWVYAREDNGQYNCQGAESLKCAHKSFNQFQKCKQHDFEGYKSVYIFKAGHSGDPDFRHPIKQWDR